MPTPNTNTQALPVYEVDTLGRPIDDTSNTSGRAVVGNTNSGTTDVGAPVKIGGVASTATPTAVTIGQRVNAWFSTNGAINAIFRFVSGNAMVEDYNGADARASVGGSLIGSTAYGFVYNNASWDRVRGDTTGTWVHAPGNTADSSLSNTITTSGAVVNVVFIPTARQEIINPSTSTIWARWGADPVVNGAGSFPIAPGGSFSTDRTNGTLRLLSTAATQPYTVNRYS